MFLFTENGAQTMLIHVMGEGMDQQTFIINGLIRFARLWGSDPEPGT